jgi:hypothetical protein
VEYGEGLRLQAEIAELRSEGRVKNVLLSPCLVISTYAITISSLRNQKEQVSSAVNKAQQATLNAVFNRPTKADIRWSAIESLIRALGGEVTERAGSRVAARLNGVTAVFHRPHPKPETKKGAVDAVRQFMINAGVKP